jgi:hypothetical protein
MDVRQYFSKIRQVEGSLQADYQIVVSLETSDGGKAGILSEVTRANAAKLIVEGRATVATEEQKEEFRCRHNAVKNAAEKAEMLKQIQISLLQDVARQGSAPAIKTTGTDKSRK